MHAIQDWTDRLPVVGSASRRRRAARAKLPPGPNASPVVQLASWIYRPIQLMEENAKRFGDTFTIQFPKWDPEILFSSPRAIKEIFTGSPDSLFAGEANAVLEPLVGRRSLLLLERERHLEERRLMLPPLHGERMHEYGETMREIADAHVDRWPLHTRFPIHGEMQSITLDVILRTVFGVSEGPLARLRALIIEMLALAANPLMLVDTFQVRLGPLTNWSRLEVVFGEIDGLLYREIARRRKEGCAGRTDIFSMLVEARYEDGRPMSDVELRDEMMTLLVAGHETTATALAWAIFRVHHTPGVHERLLAELRDVAGRGPIRDVHLPRLEYLDAVVKETLRLNPVIPLVGRRLQEPMTIGGVDLPRGVIAVPCVYLTHRRPDVWPEPERFRPERFLGLKPDPYQFFPFGGGVRRCIGMAFALYEMKMVLAQVLLRTRLRLEAGYEGRVARRSITFTPEAGVPITVDERSGDAR